MLDVCTQYASNTYYAISSAWNTSSPQPLKPYHVSPNKPLNLRPSPSRTDQNPPRNPHRHQPPSHNLLSQLQRPRHAHPALHRPPPTNPTKIQSRHNLPLQRMEAPNRRNTLRQAPSPPHHRRRRSLSAAEFRKRITHHARYASRSRREVAE